jgi:hypothetical protein
MSDGGSSGERVADDLEAQQRESRLRRRAVVAAALALAALIAAIVLTSRSGSPEGGPKALRDCLDAWNFDVVALNYGVHNSISHGYRDVQVGYMPERGRALSADPDAGECAVVFAARRPDTELQSAGEIHRGNGWVPLSGWLGPADLARLQRTAVRRANAVVNQYGKLAPAEPR